MSDPSNYDRRPPSEGTWSVFAEEMMAQRDEARAEAKRHRDHADRFWAILCDTAGALGRMVPEAAPHVASWAKKVVQERDEARASLAETQTACDQWKAIAGERYDRAEKAIEDREEMLGCLEGAEAELDEIRAVVAPPKRGDLVPLMEAVRQVVQERDEARAEVEKWRSLAEERRLISEKNGQVADRAMDMLATLSDAILNRPTDR